MLEINEHSLWKVLKVGTSQQLTKAIAKKKMLERQQKELQSQLVEIDERIDELRLSWVEQLERSGR